MEESCLIIYITLPRIRVCVVAVTLPFNCSSSTHIHAGPARSEDERIGNGRELKSVIRKVHETAFRGERRAH